MMFLSFGANVKAGSTGGTPADMSISTFSTNAIVGQSVVLHFIASDLGPGNASNVDVQIILPPGLQYANAAGFDPGTLFDPSTFIWYITNAPDGDSANLYIATVAQSTGIFQTLATIISSSTPDPNPSNNSTTNSLSSTNATALADLALTKVADATNVLVGAEVDYLLTVTNLGPDDASNIVVNDFLPSGVAFISAGPLDDFSSYDPGTGLWSITNLAAGDSASLVVTVEVTATGPQYNFATITASSPGDTNSANDSALAVVNGIATGPGTPQADLAITETASTSVIQAGDEVVFTLTVTNEGPDTASNVVVEEDMPAQIATIGIVAGSGSTYDPSSELWSIPALANGGSISLVITGLVNTPDIGGDPVTNAANAATIIQSQPYDPDISNNTATVQLNTPLASAQVALAKTVDLSSVPVGGTVNFSLTVTNFGPDTIPQIIVEDDMPAGLEVANWTAPSGSSYDPTTGLWSIANLPSGTSTTLSIAATGVLPGVQVNNAEVTLIDAYDPGTSNHTASATVTVTSPQYTITSSAGPGGVVSPAGVFLVNAGDSETFTATPQGGYEISGWYLDGVLEQNGDTTFYLGEIETNHTVQVTFAPMPLCSVSGLSVNFVDPPNAGAEMLGPDDIAGLVAQPGWVNAVGPSGAVTLAGGATVNWTSQGTISLPILGLSPDFNMMQGYLSCIGGSTVISVSGLTLASYDVYVYCGGNTLQVPETRVGHYTLNGTFSLYAENTAAVPSFTGTYVESTSTTGGLGADVGNYVVFHNVTGTSFTLTAAGDSTSGTVLDAPVNGLQIVPSSGSGGSTEPQLPTPLRFTSILRTGPTNIHATLIGTPGTPIEIEISSNLVNWDHRMSTFNTNGTLDLFDSPPGDTIYYRASQGGVPGDFSSLAYSGGTGESNSTGELTFSGGLGNLQFDWQSLDPALGPINSGFLTASNIGFAAGTLTCPPRVTFQGGTNGTQYNVTLNMGSLNQATVDITRTVSNILYHVRFFLTFNIILDIDADNNDGLGVPDMTPAERKIKDTPGLPGKVVRVNDTDENANGIPGFADFNDAPTKQFAKLVLQIPAPIDLTKAQITFTYNASDPAAVVVGGPVAARTYMPGPGNLRIWTKDAGVARDKTSAAASGNYIPSGVKMPVSKLGFTGNLRSNIFYVEGISPGAAPGDQRIEAAVDALGDGSAIFKDAVRSSVVKVTFSRAGTEDASGNKYGFDEMTPALNSGHVDVAQNDQTYVNVMIRGLTNAGPLVFATKDNTTSQVQTPAATPATGFLLRVLGQNVTSNETQIEVRSGTNGDLCAFLTNDVYRLKALNGKYYRVYKTGDTNTLPPLIPAMQIQTNANNFLKYSVISVTLMAPVQKAIAFDKNGNGKVDYYNNGDNPELDAIYDVLKADGISYSDMVMFKDGFIDNWYISASVAAGSNVIRMPSVSGLTTGRNYRIALPDDSDAETFTITTINRANNTITINPAVTRAHPRTADVATTSTVKDDDYIIAGLSSNVAANQPALLVGATPDKTGKLLAHEQMHGQGLSDVNNTANVMHWNTGSTPTTRPFTFANQGAVVTGTPTPKTNTVTRVQIQQNQWGIPPR